MIHKSAAFFVWSQTLSPAQITPPQGAVLGLMKNNVRKPPCLHTPRESGGVNQALGGVWFLDRGHRSQRLQAIRDH